MIYTVTLNPSLDYVVSVPDFQMGKTNRTAAEEMRPGGKGINVSMVMKNLGVDSLALGFTAGFTGKAIRERLNDQGLRTDFIHIEQGYSRINMKLKEFDGTEINGRGPAVGEKEMQQLWDKLDRITGDDILVLAGSIPETIPDTIYRDIIQKLAPRGTGVVTDAEGQLLRQVIPCHPFLIKPNHHELGGLFGVTLSEKEEVVPYARKLQEEGAVNVLVSMSGKGAVLVDAEGGVHMAAPPAGRLVNAVGAGDSMVAGFLVGWEESHSYDHAFRMGVAAGSATAFARGLASGEEILQLYKKIVDR